MAPPRPAPCFPHPHENGTNLAERQEEEEGEEEDDEEEEEEVICVGRDEGKEKGLSELRTLFFEEQLSA